MPRVTRKTPHFDCDVAVVGGGPAGLSAALVLGRHRRSVVLFDSGRYRNAVSKAVHGFLTRDGMDPAEMRRVGRDQLEPYETVRIRALEVTDARTIAGGFELAARDGSLVTCRRLLLATGLVDILPSIPGADELYGASLFHCPSCDGWEVRDQPLGIYGKGDVRGGNFAHKLTIWSRDIVLFTDGPGELSRACRSRLDRRGIRVCEEKIERLEPDGMGLRIVLIGQERVSRRALFFNIGKLQRTDLPTRLGCRMDDKGGIAVNRHCETSVPGLFTAGDASRDVLHAIVGAAEGSQAAVAIDTSLYKEDRDRDL